MMNDTTTIPKNRAMSGASNATAGTAATYHVSSRFIVSSAITLRGTIPETEFGWSSCPLSAQHFTPCCLLVCCTPLIPIVVGQTESRAVFHDGGGQEDAFFPGSGAWFPCPPQHGEV